MEKCRKSASRKTQRWYTVYRAKDDTIVACGTADMVCTQLGFANRNCLHSAINHSNKRNSANRKYIFVVEPISQRAYNEVLWAQRRMDQKTKSRHTC